MTGLEPRTSGIGSNRSTNWATTTAHHEAFIWLVTFVAQGMPIRIGTSCEMFWSQNQSWKKIWFKHFGTRVSVWPDGYRVISIVGHLEQWNCPKGMKYLPK